MAGAGSARARLSQLPRHHQPHGRHHLQLPILLDILLRTMGRLGLSKYDYMDDIDIGLLYIFLGFPLQFPCAILSVVQL